MGLGFGLLLAGRVRRYRASSERMLEKSIETPTPAPTVPARMTLDEGGRRARASSERTYTREAGAGSEGGRGRGRKGEGEGGGVGDI